MELYFLRHAIAVPRGSPGYPDNRLRPLTPSGEKKMQRGARGMKRLGLAFDLILSSPYRRAKQTAHIVAGIYRCNHKLKFNPALASGGNPRDLVNLLNSAAAASATRILLVGHEPYLSSLLSVLLSGEENLGLTLKRVAFAKLQSKPCTLASVPNSTGY